MTPPVSVAHNDVYSSLVAPVCGNDLSKEVCGHVSVPLLCDSMRHMCENLKWWLKTMRRPWKKTLRLSWDDIDCAAPKQKSSYDILELNRSSIAECSEEDSNLADANAK